MSERRLDLLLFLGVLAIPVTMVIVFGLILTVPIVHKLAAAALVATIAFISVRWAVRRVRRGAASFCQKADQPSREG